MSTNITFFLIIDFCFCFQVYMDSEEGKRYMQFYKFKEWPYVAIIDPFTGENGKIMSLLMYCKSHCFVCFIHQQILLAPVKTKVLMTTMSH